MVVAKWNDEGEMQVVFFWSYKNDTNVKSRCMHYILPQQKM